MPDDFDTFFDSIKKHGRRKLFPRQRLFLEALHKLLDQPLPADTDWLTPDEATERAKALCEQIPDVRQKLGLDRPWTFTIVGDSLGVSPNGLSRTVRFQASKGESNG
jgi:hypothetical protein